MTTNDPNIGPLEMEVLGLLQEGEELSVADLQKRLTGIGRKLAYTTVMTVLTRLNEKGLLRREKVGKSYRYARAKAGARVGTRLLGRLQRTLFANERLRPILAFLKDDAELTEDELRELRRVVDEKLREREKGAKR